MNGLSSHQEALKRRWDDKGGGVAYPTSSTATVPFYKHMLGGGGPGGGGLASPPLFKPPVTGKLLGLSVLDGDITSAVLPPITIVLEGRSICHRISLHMHTSYNSLAVALRRMFVESYGDEGGGGDEGMVDIANAVPGHVVAYEDMEDDLLLVGDLNWKDFVRVAKRIRILPVKRRKQPERV